MLLVLWKKLAVLVYTEAVGGSNPSSRTIFQESYFGEFSDGSLETVTPDRRSGERSEPTSRVDQ